MIEFEKLSDLLVLDDFSFKEQIAEYIEQAIRLGFSIAEDNAWVDDEQNSYGETLHFICWPLSELEKEITKMKERVFAIDRTASTY